MVGRGIFKVTAVSTRSVGIRAARPDRDAARGHSVMRELVRIGSTKSQPGGA